MPKGVRSEIEYLPSGWYWVAAGEQNWTTSTGKTSTARHGYNPTTGATLSTRQVQNIQRQVRGNLGQPKAPTIPRKGRSRTIKPTEGQTGKFNKDLHGRVEVAVYRTFADARADIAARGLPDWSTQALIQIRYKKKLKDNTPGSDQKAGKGFATLTGYETRDDFVLGAAAVGSPMLTKTHPNVWEVAEVKIVDYDMTGKDSRVFVYYNEY